MVARGNRRSSRYPFDDGNDDEEEEMDPRSDVEAETAARVREARFLAHEALRMAKAAREAAMRLKEYRVAVSLPYRGGNNIDVDDTSTLRDGGSASRSL